MSRRNSIREAQIALGVIPDGAGDESATVRRTRRNNELIEAGRHPATLRPLLPLKADLHCGDCAHHLVAHGNTKTYHKCARHRLGPSHSEASDIRVSWPACELFEPAPDLPEAS